MKKMFGILIALVMVLGLSVSAHATLTSIGTATYGGVSDYNLIYDDDLNITWLDYNDGVGSWDDQRVWAAWLNTGVLTYNIDPGVTVSWTVDWRLPDSDTCSGYNCTGSEMGHLFYDELGGTAGSSILTSGDPDLALFSNLQDGDYWSGTEYSDDRYALRFRFYSGGQTIATKYSTYYALAVRPGDVSIASVPEPGTMLLLGSGLVGLGLVRRRFKA